MISLGGSNPPDDLGQLLPFPPDRDLKGSNNLKVSTATAQTFFKLVAANELPIWAVADLVRYSKQWQR